MFKKIVKGVLIVNGILFLPNAIVAFKQGWDAAAEAERHGGSFKDQVKHAWAEA